MLARISGVVLGVERVQGTARATGNPYDFSTVTVFVAGRDVAKITLQAENTLDDGLPLRVSPGDLADWLVDFDVYRGNISCSIRAAEYPDDSAALAAFGLAAA